MTYTPHVKEVCLPAVPDDVKADIIAAANMRIAERTAVHNGINSNHNYDWIPLSAFAADWCHKNISPDIEFGAQIIVGNLSIHKDIQSKVKLINNLTLGGPEIRTRFYDVGGVVQTDTCFKENTWYILNVGEFHDVYNFPESPTEIRIAITGRVSP